MITFTSLGGYSVRCTGGQRPIAVFAEKLAGDDVLLMAAPEENPRKGVISWPGEYDVGGIAIRGVGQEEGQAVSYTVEIEGIRCAFPCAPLREWTEEDIAHLGEVHVLAIPGDESKVIQKLIDEVDPRVLLLLPGKNGSVHPDILKLCGAVGKEAVTEHKQKGLPAEGREVVVFA